MARSPDLRVVADPRERGGPAASASDEELMLLTRAGSHAAYGALAERYLVRVVSYCAKFTADPSVGEEIGQEVFLQLWAHRARYRPESSFTVFLFTIARNRCRNHGRWWRRLVPRLSHDEHAAARVAAPELSQLEAMLAAERKLQVYGCLGRLPAKQREALLLRVEQELDYGQIAKVLGCPEATARTRVFHGLRRLRELLGKEGP